MESHPESVSRFRFGDFEADLRSGELRRNGVKIKLQEQPFQILASLLERPGDVVTREELRKKLWPDNIFVDFENGLNVAMKKLRRALGDEAEPHAFIETLPKRGYRFIALVDSAGTNRQAPAHDVSERELLTAETRTEQTVARVDRKTVAIALAAIFVVVLAVVGIRSWVIPGDTHPAIRSLAVLPLQNLSGDPAQDYFADGMTEELIDKLSKIPGLRVPAPRTSFFLKGKKMPIAEVGRTLGVAYVLDGSIRKAGAQLRVAARLIRTDNGYVVWSETYERPWENALKVQDDIAVEVAGAVRTSLEAKHSPS